MNNPQTLPEAPAGTTLGLLIKQVRSEFVRAFEDQLEAQGISLRFAQVIAIKHLAANGAMSPSVLARAIEHDAGALTRMLDQLERKGYLRRQPDPQDRRALRIELTECGEALWTHIDRANQQVLRHAQRLLSDDEQAQLRGYLERVLSALRSSEPTPTV